MTHDIKSTKIDLKQFRIDFLSGLTVALALVPEAIAFALVAGLTPLVGLYSAFMVGLITAVFGGRPGMISGATGAMAVVIVSLVATHGPEYLFAAVLLAGLLQICVGLLRLGKFIRLVPHPVLFGFVNGLAIVIFLAQLEHFKLASSPGASGAWMNGAPLYTMLGLIALTMVAIYTIPKLTKVLPASLAAIVLVSSAVIGLHLDTKTVGDLASINGGLPQFHLPLVALSFETLKVIFPYSIILAGVGLIESLLTLTLVDELTETRGKSNRECVAQGSANVLSGLFGGMGGCAMIGQSIINVSSGGRSRVSGITAAVFLLIFVLFGSSLIEQIPIAALVGLMFTVSIGTFEWSSFRLIGKVPRSDLLVLVTVSVVTVIFDLAVAVLLGVVMSALVFAWDNAVRIRARKRIDEDGTKHYEIYGPLFFGSASLFQEKFEPRTDPDQIIIDFKESRIVGHSGIEVVQKVTDRYRKEGKNVRLRHLSPDCIELLGKAGSLVDVDICTDPRYSLAVD